MARLLRYLRWFGLGLLLINPNTYAFYDGWDVQYEIEQLELANGKKFNLISIAPENVKAKLDAVQGKEREDLFWLLYWNRMRANRLLNSIVEFVVATLRPGMVEAETEPELRQYFQRIRSGKYPFMAVTAPRNDSHIFQVFGMGLDVGNGLPNEERLKNAPGMKPLPRTLGAEGPIPICYVPPFGLPKCDKEISKVLSKIPRKHGDAAEVRTMHKLRTSPFDFTELLIARALSKHRFTWGGRLLPKKERLPPLEPPLLNEVLALQKRHPEIPEVLLFPEKQERYAISHLYGHTLTDSRETVFNGTFGSHRVMDPFPDIHFPKRFAHWMGLDMSTFGENSGPAIANLFSPGAIGLVAKNFRDPMWCALQLGTVDMEAVAALPNDYYSIMRLHVESDFILPEDSFLQAEKQKYVPD